MSKINKNAFQRIRSTGDIHDLMEDDELLDEVMEDTYQRTRRKGAPVLEDKAQFVEGTSKVGGVSRFRPKKSTKEEDDLEGN